MVPPAESGASATEYDYHGHKHPYHLVDPSPWPFIGSISAMVLAVGAVLYMHEELSWVMSCMTRIRYLNKRLINVHSTSKISMIMILIRSGKVKTVH